MAYTHRANQTGKSKLRMYFLWTLCVTFTIQVRWSGRLRKKYRTQTSDCMCAHVHFTVGKIDSTTNLFTFIYLNSKRKQNKIEEIIMLLLLPSNNCKY